MRFQNRHNAFLPSNNAPTGTPVLRIKHSTPLLFTLPFSDLPSNIISNRRISTMGQRKAQVGSLPGQIIDPVDRLGKFDN
jgi:hypothetical protein